MFSQLNAKVLLVVLLLSATVAKADGGLIFLEKILMLRRKQRLKWRKRVIIRLLSISVNDG